MGVELSRSDYEEWLKEQATKIDSNASKINTTNNIGDATKIEQPKDYLTEDQITNIQGASNEAISLFDTYLQSNDFKIYKPDAWAKLLRIDAGGWGKAVEDLGATAWSKGIGDKRVNATEWKGRLIDEYNRAFGLITNYAGDYRAAKNAAFEARQKVYDARTDHLPWDKNNPIVMDVEKRAAEAFKRFDEVEIAQHDAYNNIISLRKEWTNFLGADRVIGKSREHNSGLSKPFNVLLEYLRLRKNRDAALKALELYRIPKTGSSSIDTPLNITPEDDLLLEDWNKFSPSQRAEFGSFENFKTWATQPAE